MVIVNQDSWGLGRLILVITEPGHFQCFLEVCVTRVILRLDRFHLTIIFVNLLNHQISPIDEGCVLILLELLSVSAIYQDPGASPHILLTHLGVLGVSGGFLTLQLLPLDEHRNIVGEVDRGVARHHGVQHLLVEGPDLIPLHVVDGPAGALRDDELLERLHGEAAPHDAAHCRHARVVPAVHGARVHQPGQLPLGHERVGEVEPRVGVDVRLADPQRVNEPVELLVAVHVLGGPQCVRDSLHAVHDGTREVVGGIDLVLVAGGGVRLGLAAVDGGVAHAAVVGLHVHLGAHRTLGPRLRPLLHLLPHLEILLNTVAAVFAVLQLLALLLHRLCVGIVHISLPAL